MPKLEFVGQSARDADNPAGSTSRLINGYREPMVSGGRSGYVLRAVPGMAEFATVDSVFMRALGVYDDALLAVVGTNLYSIAADGTVALIGDVDATDELTGIDRSTGLAVIVAGRKYWTWDGTTLTDVTSGAGTGLATEPTSVAYLGGYVILSQFDSRVFAWSNLAAPGTFNGLNFASAEITDDPIIRIIAFKDALYIFKATGFERWALTGLSGPDAFQRIGGAQEEPGLAAYGLITVFPNGFAFVASDGRTYVSGVGPISTPPVEVAIERLGPERLFYYEQRGHGFICIAFRDCPAWCYDTATGEWHERDQGGADWQARATVKLEGEWYLGTDAGRVAKLTNACRDFGAPLVRRFVSRTLDVSRRVRVSSIEAFPRIMGDVQGDGDTTEAKVTLRTSRDGIQFGSPKDRGVGQTGAYETRLIWRELGQFRRATVELSLSATVDVPLLAEIDVVVA